MLLLVTLFANNYALMCKRFYINRLSPEVGIFSNFDTNTYSKVHKSKEIYTNLKYCSKFEMIVTDKQKDMSVMY